MEIDEIVKRVQAGDVESYRDIVEQFQSQVFTIVCKHGLPLATAEELTQEIFLRAFRAIKSFRFQSKFSTWLTRITLNTAQTHLTSRTFRERERSLSLNELAPGHQWIQTDSSQEQKMLANERTARLFYCLQKLDPKYREPIVLSALDGAPYEDVAAQLNIPTGTVRSRINRARLLMLECFRRS